MKNFVVVIVMLLGIVFSLEAQEKVSSVVTSKTPSYAQYFNWINSTNEGTTEKQTLINLDFFRWLKDAYGMNLDIYAFDAGVIDGKRFYGSMDSERFRSKFPEGFKNVFQKVQSMGTSLGLWGGPDGFGVTLEDARERQQMWVKLCQDYGFKMFKLDGVCGSLRPGKDLYLAQALDECRKYVPDLIVLNHRLDLGKAMPYATTYLWEGRETYIDVFTSNSTTAPHHRAGSLSIGLTPNLDRMVEDCGVCLSSCLDYWDDELILQTFNRSLILSPEIYGNPWLLKDSEFPKLARIFNLHKRYASLLVNGIKLPSQYGIDAVSRGDNNTRLLTFRNLSWEPQKLNLTLNEEIGISAGSQFNVRMYHPVEQILGSYNYGENVTITLPAFRSALLLVNRNPKFEEIGVKGVEYQVVKDIEEEPVEINLLGMPGASSKISLCSRLKFKKAFLGGKDVTDKLRTGFKVMFGGEKLKHPVHRKLSVLNRVSVEEVNTQALYESTVFAADNNALEVRSLIRSGKSCIPEVEAARNAFFTQPTFVERGIWDKNLFDNDMDTGFWPSRKYGISQSVKGGCFRLDLGAVCEVDSVIVKVKDCHALEPLLLDEGNVAFISSDLKSWDKTIYIAGKKMVIPVNKEIRYLKLNPYPSAISEIEVYYKGKKLDSTRFRANNLFADGALMDCKGLWKGCFTLDELAENSYLSVALNGMHGCEGAYAALVVDGKIIGATDRAVSYPSNTWEYVNSKSSSNYTYYFPLTNEIIGKEIIVYVMGYEEDKLDFIPEVWISSYDPYKKMRLSIER